MNNEIIKISVCCKKEVVVYGDEKNRFMCKGCGLACAIEEVCMYCLGEGKVSDERFDSDSKEWVRDSERDCICQVMH